MPNEAAPVLDPPYRERAVSGVHERAVAVLEEECPPAGGKRALDVGAGEGGLSVRLARAGYEVEGCDLFPEQFRPPDIPCSRVDLNEPWPYADDSFDAAIAVEVIEHIEDHMLLFRETARVVRAGGTFLFTTPNILSFKSRLSFLFSGYFYSFGPIRLAEHTNDRPHVTPFTIDRYRHVLGLCGLELERVAIDKRQNSSRTWAWLAPIVRWNARRRFGSEADIQQQNSPEALFGRTLIVVARVR